MSFDGNTVLVGDSITALYGPFMPVNGKKTIIATPGFTTNQVLHAAVDSDKSFDDATNVVVLAGTNDLKTDLTAPQIFSQLQAIWGIAKRHGSRLYVLTVPPAIGFTGWRGKDVAVDKVRRQLNDLIKSSTTPDFIFDSDQLGDAQGRLLPDFDIGDHVHPRGDALAALLNIAVMAKPLPVPTLTPPARSFLTVPRVALAGLVIGAGWIIGRRRSIL